MKNGRREILIFGSVGDPDVANVNHGTMVGILSLLFAVLRLIDNLPTWK
jgi:hypothetical protein